MHVWVIQHQCNGPGSVGLAPIKALILPGSVVMVPRDIRPCPCDSGEFLSLNYSPSLDCCNLKGPRVTWALWILWVLVSWSTGTGVGRIQAQNGSVSPPHVNIRTDDTLFQLWQFQKNVHLCFTAPVIVRMNTCSPTRQLLSAECFTSHGHIIYVSSARTLVLLLLL